MSVSKYNAEGYHDPTAHEALTNIVQEERAAKYRPLVYICSPYAGDVAANVANAQRYSRYAVDRHCIPIAPHLLFPQFLDDTNSDERSLGLFMGNVLLGKCSEVWVFGDRISTGMSAEIKKAEHKSLPIRRFTTTCEEVH